MVCTQEYKHFGTDGIRGIVGSDFDAEYVFRIARAAARTCVPKRVIIGCDTRKSCGFIENIFSGVFAGVGADVIKVGIVPTAALSFLTHKIKADLGVMISASHNDYRYNGIKFFSKNGEKLDDKTIKKIDGLIDGDVKLFTADATAVGYVKNNNKLIKLWYDFLIQKFKFTKKLCVAVDCSFGSGAECVKKVLNALGIDITLFNTEYDGININRGCGVTEPASLQEIMQRSAKFDIGFALDGDADRCVAFNRSGEIIHGDVLLCCLAKYMEVKRVVSTILFNLGAEIYLQKNGIEVLRTPVGDRHVTKVLKENCLSLGGETSGHIVFPHIWHSGDGLLTALMILLMIEKSGKSLSELCDGIKVFPQACKNIPVTSEQKQRIKRYLSNAESSTLVKTDGGYRAIVRLSGTENLVRIVVEGEELATCERRCEQVQRELFSALD